MKFQFDGAVALVMFPLQSIQITYIVEVNNIPVKYNLLNFNAVFFQNIHLSISNSKKKQKFYFVDFIHLAGCFLLKK